MAWFGRSRSRSGRAQTGRLHKKLRLEPLEDRSLLTLLGNQLFPGNNPWNQRISDAPVASNSAAIMNNLVTSAGNGRLHPDFGQDYDTGDDLYGIPYNVVHGNDPNIVKTSVIIDAYDDESDILPAPIPANPVLEGDYQNGPRVGVNNRGDSHLIVYDVDNNIVYEYYRASRPSENTDGRWHADQQSVWDLKTNTFRRLGDTSADAAGLPILTGLARPDEGLPVSQGGQGVINHAIRMTLQNAIILDQFVYPASHTANPGNNNTAIQPPMGARFRLKASVDISQLNPQAKVIAQAMKDYGMIVADNGSNFYFTGAARAVNASNQQTLTWNDDDIQDSTRGLKSLRFSDFEVVDLTPIVTSLSAASSPIGSTLTITGKNFTGAAGNLRVLFGGTAASSVTVLDDTHVQVVVPTGTGSVDVRVQSGATTASNPDNYENPIFGYGISAVTTAGRFTFSVVTNQPPTVSTAAKISHNPVAGTATNLSALGADDGGETNLRYTWSSSAGPVTFAANGTHAAKNTSAIFTQPGEYVLTVTIADAAGLTTTSTVPVIVLRNLRPAIVGRATASPGVVTSTTTALSVTAIDDTGGANLQYTWSSTGPAPVSFSVNGTQAARNTIATFSQAGSYNFTVTVRDSGGLTSFSTTTVGVNPGLGVTANVAVQPEREEVPLMPAAATSADFRDPLGATLDNPPPVTWMVRGRQRVDESIFYLAPRRAVGPCAIRTAPGGVTGTAQVIVGRTILPLLRERLSLE